MKKITTYIPIIFICCFIFSLMAVKAALPSDDEIPPDVEINCCNGIDDDMDGLTDFEDNDCQPPSDIYFSKLLIDEPINSETIPYDYVNVNDTVALVVKWPYMNGCDINITIYSLYCPDIVSKECKEYPDGTIICPDETFCITEKEKEIETPINNGKAIVYFKPDKMLAPRVDTGDGYGYYWFNVTYKNIVEEKSENKLYVYQEGNTAPYVNISSPETFEYEIGGNSETIQIWLNATAEDEDDLITESSWLIYNQSEDPPKLINEIKKNYENTPTIQHNVLYEFSPGSYTIVFRATDERNKSSEAKKEIVVYKSNSEQAPVAIITKPIHQEITDTGVNVTLNGTQSYDPDDCTQDTQSCAGQGIITYIWKIENISEMPNGQAYSVEIAGNETSIVNVTLFGSSEQVITYRIYLGVIDDEGDSSFTYTDINVDLTQQQCLCESNGIAVACGACINNTHYCKATGNGGIWEENCAYCSIFSPSGIRYGCKSGTMCAIVGDGVYQCKEYSECNTAGPTCYEENGEWKSCREINDGGLEKYCAGYTTQQSCENDLCLAAFKECLENEKCIEKMFYEGFDAKCEWIDEQCKFIFTWEQDGQTYKCIETRTFPKQCPPGARVETKFSWELYKDNAIGNENEIKQLCHDPVEWKQTKQCPQAFIHKVPGFSRYSAILVVLLLSLYYVSKIRQRKA